MTNVCKNSSNIANLPVPELNDTLEMYLEWLKPIATENEYNKTKSVVEEFKNSENSTVIQNALIEKSKDTDNSWIADWWIQNAYLTSRGPVTPECNAGLEIVFDYKNGLNTLQKIALFMHGLANSYIEFKTNPNSYFDVKTTKMSLDQLNGAYCSMRLFGKDRDSYYINTNYNEFITFLYKNNVVNIKVIDNNKPVPFSEIYNTLHKIIDNTIGINVNANFMSASCNRGKTAKLYSQLYEMNAESIDKVNDSIAVVSYDDIDITSYDESINNTYRNSEYYNRWHGKGLSVIFTNNTCSIVADHTYIDGGTEIYIAERVNHYISNCDQEFVEANETKMEYLSFILGDLTSELKECETEYANYLSQTSYDLVEFSLDKEKLVNNEIYSVDGFMQLLFQYANKQTFNKFIPTYESVDVRNFFRGRTECLRPISNQSVNAVKCIENDDRDNLRNAIVMSSNEHYKRLKNCKAGLGVNRHLFGLYHTAKEMNIECELFSDKGYELISNNQISTSSLTNRLVKYFYFQQVDDKGFGISYQMGDNPKFIISSKNSSLNERNKFIESFKECLEYIYSSL